jgi:succinate-semialdehyde dehydrogenase/glutarate-semialdehyde dehydrogenase
MYESFGLFIDGEWRAARRGRTIDVIDPATEERIGAIPHADIEDLDDALNAASRAQRIWSVVAGWERSRVLRAMADILRGRADEAATMMARESGKPFAEARGEFGAAVDQFDWCADEARRIFGHTLGARDSGARLDVEYRAVGPVAAFTAWNFPALLPARKIAAALAAGCAIIVKPSAETPSSVFLFAEATKRAGLPNGAS